jgi:hypothetical protein
MNNNVHEIEYIEFLDGSVCVNYRLHSDDGEIIKPTYQKLCSDIKSAEDYVNNLNK